MKKLVVAVVAVLAIYSLFKFEYPTYTYRYRMTVEIDAGSEVRSGSSVIEVNAWRQPHFLPEVRPYDEWARGQAVFVALPERKNIVALLASGATGEHGDYPLKIISNVFKSRIESLPKLRGRRELTVDQMPTLITVSNPRDAKTAQVVKPNALDGLLGVHLRSISVEMTTDPVTTIDIDSKLPFVNNEEKERHQITYPNAFSPRSSIFVRR